MHICIYIDIYESMQKCMHDCTLTVLVAWKASHCQAAQKIRMLYYASSVA